MLNDTSIISYSYYKSIFISVHIFSKFQASRSSSSSSSAFAKCCPSAAEYLVVEYIGLRWSATTLEAQRTALFDSAAQGSVCSVQGALLWWLAPSQEGQASEGLAKGFHSPDWGVVSDFDVGNECKRELQSRILAEHVPILTTQRHANSLQVPMAQLMWFWRSQLLCLGIDLLKPGYSASESDLMQWMCGV